MSSKPFKAAIVSLMALIMAMPTVPVAREKKERDYAGFTVVNGRRAQKYLDLAMHEDMAYLLRRAARYNADYIMAYGLALELGRTPATMSMNDADKAAILTMFQEVLNIYIKTKDNVALKGNEMALLEFPDFWMVISRSMSFMEMSSNYAGDSMSMGGQSSGIGSSSVSVTTDTVYNTPRYKLGGVTPQRMATTTAAQSCAIAARAAARMKKVMKIDPSAAPHLTVEQVRDNQAMAEKIYNESVSTGKEACGGLSYFKKVYAVAEANLGSLNRLEEDPTRAAEVDEKTKLPEDAAPEAK